MSSFAIRTNVKDLIVTIESTERGPVLADIFIHKVNYISTNEPTFSLEYAKRGVRATFTDILKEVEYGVNYHYILNETNKKEFMKWLKARISMQDILADFDFEIPDEIALNDFDDMIL